MSLCTTTKKTNKSKIFFFQQKTTFFSFLFVKNLFFHKAASLSALLELNVKKYARGRIALSRYLLRESAHAAKRTANTESFSLSLSLFV